jgi:hypothetical protein
MHDPDAIAAALEAVTSKEDPPLWFEVHGDTAGAAGLVRHDDLAQLFGWVSPPAYDAIGVVAGGWGRPYLPGQEGDPLLAGALADVSSTVRPEDVPEPQRVRVIVVVDRRGVIGARTTMGDGRVVDGGCQSGRLVDALRRGLGLPTDPPAMSSAAIIGALWLAALAAEGRRCGHRLGWAEVTALHPAAPALVDDGHTLSSAEVDAVTRVAPRAWTWERLRADTISGGGLCDLVAPDIAAWMDTGMFARWSLDLSGDPRVLWGAAAAVLDQETVVRLAATLDAAEALAGGPVSPAGVFH